MKKITIIIEDDAPVEIRPEDLGLGGFRIEDEPCMIEEFFKHNPHVGAVGISCPCPKCSPRCFSVS